MTTKLSMTRNTFPQLACVCATAGLLAFVTGCQTNDHDQLSPQSSAQPAVAATTPPPATPPTTPPVTPAPAGAKAAIRIKTGVSAPITDSSGNVWQADQGFVDGDTIERPDLPIANTKDPALYRAERYSMKSFSQPVPNGKYLVKLHFCETFEGITEKGQRVFSFNVEGHEFKDFDVFARSGGFARAYIESVPVGIADGKLDITFTPNVENPQINAIEVLPQP